MSREHLVPGTIAFECHELCLVQFRMHILRLKFIVIGSMCAAIGGHEGCGQREPNVEFRRESDGDVCGEASLEFALERATYRSWDFWINDSIKYESDRRQYDLVGHITLLLHRMWHHQELRIKSINHFKIVLRSPEHRNTSNQLSLDHLDGLADHKIHNSSAAGPLRPRRSPRRLLHDSIHSTCWKLAVHSRLPNLPNLGRLQLHLHSDYADVKPKGPITWRSNEPQHHDVAPGTALSPANPSFRPRPIWIRLRQRWLSDIQHLLWCAGVVLDYIGHLRKKQSKSCQRRRG